MHLRDFPVVRALSFLFERQCCVLLGLFSWCSSSGQKNQNILHLKFALSLYHVARLKMISNPIQSQKLRYIFLLMRICKSFYSLTIFPFFSPLVSRFGLRVRLDRAWWSCTLDPKPVTVPCITLPTWWFLLGCRYLSLHPLISDSHKSMIFFNQTLWLRKNLNPA